MSVKYGMNYRQRKLSRISDHAGEEKGKTSWDLSGTDPSAQFIVFVTSKRLQFYPRRPSSILVVVVVHTWSSSTSPRVDLHPAASREKAEAERVRPDSNAIVVTMPDDEELLYLQCLYLACKVALEDYKSSINPSLRAAAIAVMYIIIMQTLLREAGQVSRSPQASPRSL